MNHHRPKAVFSISSLGLGHATRTLTVIRSYLATHEIHVVSTGNALAYLKAELSSHGATFYDLEDYPPLERGTGWRFYWYLLLDIGKTPFVIRRERKFIAGLVEKLSPEFIFSDGRYGSHSDSVPSFILSHQICFSMPKGLGLFQFVADNGNYGYFKNFDAVLIPDYPSLEHSLAGKLAQSRILKKLEHRYVGPLSSIEATGHKKDIDFLFTISGYISEHKPSFVAKLLAEAKGLPGKKVFILGNASEKTHEVMEEFGIEVYSYAAGGLRQELFNRAKAVVSRSGYTTVMDLVELGVPGFLVPTPGQTEQEYLAEHLARGQFLTTLTQDIELAPIAEKLSSLQPAAVPWKTAKSVEMVRESIEARTRHTQFSIVIPAHNEEKYLAQTLACIRDLDYPKHSYEALVIENGSKDKTLDIARSFESGNVKAHVSAPGASKAKNSGIAYASPKSDWIVLLDADTHLGPKFLSELDRYLRSQKGKRLSVGTTTVLPYGEKRLKADGWFAFYNIGHALTKTSFSIQLMRTECRSTVSFDESKTFGEDLKLIKDLLKLGSFFYLRTRQVHTSTRRFDEVGWTKLFFVWNWQALVLSRRKSEKASYSVIR